MDAKMFCFQCQQTAGGSACINTGVCGKQPSTSNLQDELVCELIKLAELSKNENKHSAVADRLIIDGLFTTLTNVNFDDNAIKEFMGRVKNEQNKISRPEAEKIQVIDLWDGDTDIVSLRSTLLFGLKGMAAYAHHAMNLGYTDNEVLKWFYKGLCEVNREHSVTEWIELIMEFGQVNFKCMELLDKANTESFGNPVPTRVNVDIKKGPFIVVSGHDLNDLSQLLEQTEKTGVNVYTHCEMLPAHGYPELNKYHNLAGNFGTAWQSQRVEFADLPAPVLFTTNCLMPPAASYADRVFTTGPVAYPGMMHVEAAPDGGKDFEPLIQRALELGGYAAATDTTGTFTTGFGHSAVLGVADTVVDAVKQGAISRFFLVGGCDGARPGRSYFRDFVQQAPDDSIILTLACGKFRFNDLDLGTIGGLPRIMDMGQCNDAYGAIRVAVALAEAFDCGVNDLPLSMVLSWYEQKAVCILLTLLHLGIKNIRLGPSLPAFLSPNILNFLVENYGIAPITTPEEDIKTLMNYNK